VKPQSSSSSSLLSSSSSGAPVPARRDVQLADLAGFLRQNRVARADLAFGALRVTGTGTVDVDAHNCSADVDANVTLAQLARALHAKGFVLPLARPLPAVSIAVACATLPFFVDALVQQASALTTDGEPYETPRAPRSATGPSLLHALCARPPLAIAVRVRVRVLPRARVQVVVHEHASVHDAARALADVHHEARAYAVDACGARVVALVGAGTPSRVAGAPLAVTAPFAHQSGRARVHSSTHIVPTDVAAIARALADGHRVALAPFMGRAAVLSRAFVRVPLVDTTRGVATLAEALRVEEGA
jgi:FAD/FMN-containing dehydrogenase